MSTHTNPGHTAIKASAGSGKTFRLAHRYIRLLAAGSSPDRIAALTFSRKAALEIFEELVKHLRLAASDPEYAKRAAALIECPGLRPGDFKQLLRTFVDHLHRVHIGTLDSFIIGVVRAFPVELGIPPRFQVTDDGGSEAHDMRDAALEQIFSPRAVDAHAQREFFEAFRQATFGKEEKDFATQLDDFIDDYRRHFQALPDAEAWGEPARIWPDRGDWLTPLHTPRPSIRGIESLTRDPSLHASLRKSLRKVIDFAHGFDESSRWDSSLDRNTVFTQLMEHIDDLAAGRMTLTYNRNEHPLSPKHAQALHRLLHRVIRIEISRALQETRGIYRVLAQYAKLYDELVRRDGRLTFSDAQYLLTPSNPYSHGSVLSREPAGEHRLYIDYRLDAALDHWLLDEFQDTSDLQWDVLRNLIDETVQDSSGRRTFFYVGDVKQAIYGWRGGNARLFNAILAQYGRRIDVKPLATSYRSCQTVIDTINTVFGSLPPSHFPSDTIDRWDAVFETHRCERAHVPADGVTALIEPPPGPDNEKPGRPDRHALVAALLRQIEPNTRGLSCAVLVRSNAEGTELVDTLRHHCPRISVTHEGKASIRDNPVVELLLSLLKIAEHPGDTFAWRHVQMSPLARTLEAHGHDRGRLSLVLLNQLHASGFQRTIRRWGHTLDSVSSLDHFGRRRLDDLTQAAGEFDQTGSRDVAAFLRFIDSYERHESAAGGSVRVMTIHQSKGLGFDMVILPELMGRDMTSARQLDFVIARDPRSRLPKWALRMPRRIVAQSDTVLAAEIETGDSDAAFDELCVLYVAMTRARRALYMVTSYPGKSSRVFNAAALLKQQLTGMSNPTEGSSLPVAGEDALCLHVSGNPEWYRDVPEVAPPTTDAAAAPNTRGALAERPSRRPALTMVRPSSRETAHSSASRLFEAETRDVLAFGTAIHSLFERIEWIEDADSGAIIDDWLNETDASEPVRRDVVAQFRKAVASPEVRAALSRPSEDALVWRERAFEVVIGDEWVSGTFDRVVLVQDRGKRRERVILSDFKSDRLRDDADPGPAVDRYRPQLELYAEALARILHLAPDRIQTQLLFTRPGRCITL